MRVYVGELLSTLPSTALEHLKEDGARIETEYGPACTHAILQYQSHEVFAQAVAARQQVATLRWLLRLVEKRVPAAPGDCVLDSPAPAHPVAGAAELRISTTGFDKHATRDLGDMITIMGAVYDRALTKQTTHLIVATCAPPPDCPRSRSHAIAVSSRRRSASPASGASRS